MSSPLLLLPPCLLLQQAAVSYKRVVAFSSGSTAHSETALTLPCARAGLALGACLNKVFSRFALRLPWHRKTPDASVAANLETVSVDRGEIPAERPSMYRLISAKSEALAQPLITRLSGSEGLQRQESLAAKAPQRSSSHLHETGLVKLSAEKLKEHTRSFAISASSSTHTPSNVVCHHGHHSAFC